MELTIFNRTLNFTSKYDMVPTYVKHIEKSLCTVGYFTGDEMYVSMFDNETWEIVRLQLSLTPGTGGSVVVGQVMGFVQGPIGYTLDRRDILYVNHNMLKRGLNIVGGKVDCMRIITKLVLGVFPECQIEFGSQDQALSMVDINQLDAKIIGWNLERKLLECESSKL